VAEATDPEDRGYTFLPSPSSPACAGATCQIDGQALTVLVKRVGAAAPTGSTAQPPAAANAPTRAAEPPKPTEMPPAAVPGYPRCGSAMIQRIAKQGANAGNPFWGCATFPKCRGVRGL
jgi:restriction system protein